MLPASAVPVISGVVSLVVVAAVVNDDGALGAVISEATVELLVTEVLLRSDTSFPELSWIALVSSPEVGSL